MPTCIAVAIGIAIAGCCRPLALTRVILLPQQLVAVAFQGSCTCSHRYSRSTAHKQQPCRPEACTNRPTHTAAAAAAGGGGIPGRVIYAVSYAILCSHWPAHKQQPCRPAGLRQFPRPLVCCCCSSCLLRRWGAAITDACPCSMATSPNRVNASCVAAPAPTPTLATPLGPSIPCTPLGLPPGAPPPPAATPTPTPCGSPTPPATALPTTPLGVVGRAAPAGPDGTPLWLPMEPPLPFPVMLPSPPACSSCRNCIRAALAAADAAAMTAAAASGEQDRERGEAGAWESTLLSSIWLGLLPGPEWTEVGAAA